jgi:hypothetical protein
LNFPNKQQILRVSFWTGITILFAAPLEVFHLLLESLHILFEWIETSLDFMIDFMFDNSLNTHTTQVVVFYIILAGIFYGLYRLWKGLPAFYSRQKANLAQFFSDETNAVLVYWQESIANKAKLLCAIAGLVFLLFI